MLCRSVNHCADETDTCRWPRWDLEKVRIMIVSPSDARSEWSISVRNSTCTAWGCNMPEATTRWLTGGINYFKPTTPRGPRNLPLGGTAWKLHSHISGSLPTASSEVAIGEELIVSARVFLDTLAPDDVGVQIMEGRLDARGNIQEPAVATMHPQDGATSGRFSSELHCTPLAADCAGTRFACCRITRTRSRHSCPA